MKRLLLSYSVLIVGIGCNAEDNAPGLSVRDSAGVQIITSGPSWAAGESWQVGSEPILSIGEVENDSTTQFQRIVGIVRISDSRVVVADAGSNNVRSFDQHGVLVSTYGRSGQGPGEFRALQSLKRFGTDSLFALDRRLSRVTVFDSAGNVARLIQVPTGFVSVYPLANNRWLAAEEEGFFGARLHEDATAGLHRFLATVAVLDSAGSLADTLGTFPGAETAYVEANGRMGPLTAAYGRVLALGTRGDEIYVGTGNELGYDVYSASGQHVRSIRARGSDRTLTSNEVSAYHDEVLNRISDPAVRTRFATRLKAAAVPEQKAPYTRLLVDSRGNVWLSDYENSYVATGIWRVIDRGGRYLGEIQTPPQLRILEVGENYVAGVWKGDLGVESVRVYPLNR